VANLPVEECWARYDPRAMDQSDGYRRWSLVPGSQAEVWARITSAAGINDELRPVLRMTMPRGMSGDCIDEVTPGEPMGKSWLLLGGVLPVDYDEMTMEVIEPPHRFREHSSMFLLEDWVHERTVRPVTDDVCVVEDDLRWVGRGPVGRRPVLRAFPRWIVRALYTHRHRRIVAHFAARRSPADLAAEPV
jgi:hypothetical protein